MADIKHFGVLGMHWGVRKAHAESGGTSGSKNPIQRLKDKKAADEAANSDDHKKVQTLRQKKVSHMTNAELQTVITRMNLEKQYAEATKRQRSAGEVAVRDFMGKAGKQISQQFVTELSKKGVEYLNKQVFDE